jgi:hypothetical protein
VAFKLAKVGDVHGELVAELRKKHKVEIDEAALAKVGAPPAPAPSP